MTEATSPFDPRRPPEAEMQPNIDDGFTMAAVGDCILSRPMSPLLDTDPAFASVVSHLRNADLAVGNLETTIVDVRSFRSHVRTADDWNLVAEPAVAGDLATLGFDLMSRANNHALDFGVEGLRETGRRVDDVGIVHAGAGEALAHARAPQYVQTPAGRIGFVSMYALETWDNDAALDAFGQMPPRPGVNGLRRRRVVTVPPTLFEEIRAVHRAAYPDYPEPEADGFKMLETRWVPGEGISVGYDMDPDDVSGILRAIRLGKQHSDLLVAAIHCHDEGPDITTPPAYVVELAHLAIDSGADVFLAHGIHRLLPIEFYRGRPILYGLGNFFWSDIAEPVQGALYADNRNKWKPVFGDLLPTDAELGLIMNAGDFAGERYFESMVAVLEFEAGISRVRLQPFDLGYGLPLTRSGLPRKPEPGRAEAILSNLAEMSEPFGTSITVEDGYGIAGQPRS